mgnify:CR=1 FL=1
MQQGLAVGAVAAWLALISLAALLVRRRWPHQREWSRKLVHIGAGLVVPLAWLLAIHRSVALSAAVAATLLALVNHRLRWLPAIEDVGRASIGTIAYGASITLLLALWWPGQPAPVCAGVLAMAVGDGLAGVVGPLRPSPSWQVMGQRRSLLGTSAMAFGTGFSLVLLAVVSHQVSLPVPSPLALAAITSLAVALEQVAWGGFDNLTVPLAVAWLWQALAH